LSKTHPLRSFTSSMSESEVTVCSAIITSDLSLAT
jgi:hypothetical protein